MTHYSYFPIASLALSIAIACGWCAVSPSMQEEQEKKVSVLSVDDIEGHKAFKTDSLLYIVLQGDNTYDDVDKFNEKYGEENVKINFYTHGVILEVKV